MANPAQKTVDETARKIAGPATPDPATRGGAAKGRSPGLDAIPDNNEIDKMNLDRLVAESRRLRSMLARMQASGNDQPSANDLSGRNWFMEEANIAFRHARRHHQPLSLLVLRMEGYDRLVGRHGKTPAMHVRSRIAKISQAITREHLDICGLIADDTIAVLLYDTGSRGCHEHLERIQNLVREQPVLISGQPADIKLAISARTLRDSHDSFVELLVSAQA